MNLSFLKREANSASIETDKIVSAVEEELKSFEIGLLDHLANGFDAGLDKVMTKRDSLEAEIKRFKDGIKSLEASIADREEQLLHAVGAIAILKRAQTDLVALSDPPPADPASVAAPAPVSTDASAAVGIVVAAALAPAGG